MAKIQLSKYQVWYQANKEKIAERRREKYRKDKKYRERSLKASRAWRKENKPWLDREKAVRDYLLIGEFAEKVGCSPETLRNLERKKLLPKTTDGVARRRYHPGNARLVTRLVDFRRNNHYSDPKYKGKLKEIVSKVKADWKKAA
jgi:hypothetical protein